MTVTPAPPGKATDHCRDWCRRHQDPHDLDVCRSGELHNGPLTLQLAWDDEVGTSIAVRGSFKDAPGEWRADVDLLIGDVPCFLHTLLTGLWLADEASNPDAVHKMLDALATTGLGRGQTPDER